MFWRFGGYANISTIDNILDKENFQLEDLLDESDLIQELKQHNSKLVEYLRDQRVLEKLLEYVVAPKLEPVASPDDDDDEEEGKGKGISLPFTRPRALSKPEGSEEDVEKKRNRYAFVAAEILSSDNWSIYEALMENRQLLRNFWQFLKRPAPLDPLQASYFTKVNESLFDKKTEELIDLLKSLENAVPDMIKHVDCPMIMDLLLKIISLERTESGQGIVEWLYTQDVIPTLLSFLGPEHSWATQTSAGDFMKAIITVSANASQNEQTCIGPNELTRQLVSGPCVEQLIKYMLGGGNPLTVGVGIIIEVIRKNNSDYDPDGPDTNTVPSSRDPIYLGTLLRMFADHVPDFMNLVVNAPSQKQRLSSTFGYKIEPLGFDRFKTCELMAELLHCSNMGLLNEVGSEELIAVRDAERQRLRTEGKLTFLRGEEAPSSVEDLTMRMSHSSPVDEGRKLEVMNISAEDDGFEEVTHAGDDDASHGVEDIPDLPDFSAATTGAPASSFLDRDEDDFVDEPLSSPRLNVREIEKVEGDNSFEDPDLVVAPLSPSKPKTVEPVPVEKTEEPAETEAVSEQEQEPAAVHETEMVTEAAQDSDKNQPLDTKLAVSTSPAEDDKSKGAEAEEDPSVDKSTSTEGMSPRPEDTPAPLFSGQNESAKATALTEDVKPAESEKQEDVPDVSASAEVLTNGQEPGEASIIVARPDDAPAPAPENQAKPVVGDYLKMQFVEHRVVPTILSFFFEFPWNNFLHNVVYDIVQQVFNGPMDRGYNSILAISLFEAADITAQIINGQIVSEESQALNKTRMGYMGHLTLIAEEVVKFTERHPPELLSETVLEKVMAQEWINYVEGALAETRERDNAILGGVRPEVAMSNRAGASGLSSVGLSGLGSLGLSGGGGSNVLAEAGLNGGSDLPDHSSGNGIGPFAISAGTLMSGFGSSSDEDDDEEQESEEDVNNEFRAYTDPLNSSLGNSMNPPSIPPPPPPPPPLNVPPSRARLQFAARLAMNKRNAAASGHANGQEGSDNGEDSGTSGFSLPNLSSNDRLRDPFADGDDDEGGSGSGSDDDADMGDGDGGVGSSSWNRGSWWRGVVRGSRRANRNSGAGAGEGNGGEVERFGDGRDDSSDEDGAGVGDDDDMEDEEFGDFAMPEVDRSKDGKTGDGSLVTGIDPAREKILLKPLPVHPGVRSSASPFGSLWPFSTQGFGSGIKEKKDEKDAGFENATGSADHGIHVLNEKAEEEEVPVQLEDHGIVTDEDGKKIDRAIEAKRRTSIEDPDEDDVEVGEEIIVGRAGLA